MFSIFLRFRLPPFGLLVIDAIGMTLVNVNHGGRRESAADRSEPSHPHGGLENALGDGRLYDRASVMPAVPRTRTRDGWFTLMWVIRGQCMHPKVCPVIGANQRQYCAVKAVRNRSLYDCPDRVALDLGRLSRNVIRGGHVNMPSNDSCTESRDCVRFGHDNVYRPVFGDRNHSANK